MVILCIMSKDNFKSLYHYTVDLGINYLAFESISGHHWYFVSFAITIEVLLVLYMYYTCTVHVLYMYCTCTIHVLYMYYTCTIHVLYMYCTCTIHVLYMYTSLYK